MDDDHTMQNLKIVSTLKANQKLNTSQVRFTVQENTSFSGVIRLWHGEDRNINIARVSALFNVTMLRCEVLALTSKHSSTHIRLMQLIREATGGLRELIATYREDITSVSHIEVLIENVDSFMAKDGQAPSTQEPSVPYAELR